MLSTTIELRRMVVAMYEEQFSKRLTELRTQKGVSARDMSLSIGQNPGYIRAIESGTAFPTMANFFYICEYFNICLNFWPMCYWRHTTISEWLTV